jgi:YD repeat-containing protein
MFITKKLLKTHKACKDGINFFNTYFPDGVDTDKIKVTGDYNGYWKFIKYLPEIKLDDNGNKIWEKYQNGNILEFKYDENNNKIWVKYPNGIITEWEFKYDDNNNLIWKKYPNGNIWEAKYDDNNNKIWEKYQSGSIYEYKYDQNNNKIWQKDPGCHITEWKFTVGVDNRLEKILENDEVICSIEYLEDISKPPFGLKPKYIHDEERKEECHNSIVRYLERGKKVPIEWLEEYNSYCE